MTTGSDTTIAFTSIPRVKLLLRAGMTEVETEPDLTRTEPLLIPTSELRSLNFTSARLLSLRVRDIGMEPMFFEDDWVVIDLNDTVIRSGDVYAVKWNGEACIQQLVKHGGQWYLSYANPTFQSINTRSGQLQVVGRVVYQAGRPVTGRL